MATAAAIALTVALTLPTGWLLGRRDRTIRRQEHAARPPDPHAAVIAGELTLGLHALAHACCLTAAVTAGTDHDPRHCTRKDHTL